MPWRYRTALRRTFFEDRVAGKDISAIRAYAAEILACMPVMGLFCRLVLEPAGLYPDWRRFTYMMCEILHILRLGDEAVQHWQFLRDHMVRYHVRALLYRTAIFKHPFSSRSCYIRIVIHAYFSTPRTR